jgi:hypothetical protein
MIKCKPGKECSFPDRKISAGEVAAPVTVTHLDSHKSQGTGGFSRGLDGLKNYPPQNYDYSLKITVSISEKNVDSNISKIEFVTTKGDQDPCF